jgi:hypothetical protein
MSREARDWAWQQPVKNSHKLVLLALAEYADAQGYCFPGRTTISDKTRLHKSTVTVALAALENDGYIERGRRARGNGSRTSDGCTLHLGRNSRPSANPRSQSTTPQGRVSLHPRSQFPSTKVVNRDPHNRKRNQKDNRKTEPAPADVELSPLEQQALEQYSDLTPSMVLEPAKELGGGKEGLQRAIYYALALAGGAEQTPAFRAAERVEVTALPTLQAVQAAA